MFVQAGASDPHLAIRRRLREESANARAQYLEAGRARVDNDREPLREATLREGDARCARVCREAC